MNRKTSPNEIIAPDAEITISGRQVTVRAFRFLEGLRATSLARPLIDDLRTILAQGDNIEIDSILDLLGQHPDTWLQLICMSAREDASWISNLNDEDGMTLAMTFWAVNKNFFMMRLVLSEVMRAAVTSSRTKLSVNSSGQVTDEISKISLNA